MSSSGRGNKKCRKSGESDDMDRLSNLPDGVISHILSCLPAKNAIQTCVLSRAWEHNWESAHCFKIDVRIPEEEYKDYPYYEPMETDKGSLISCVYKIFRLSPNIRSFELLLSDDEFHTCYLESWLNILFERKIENVKLHAPVIPKPPKGIVLSRHLLCCTSLRELELRLCCTFKVQPKIYFPNLTRLHLDYVQFKLLDDDSSIDTLVFSFPMLKRLVLRSCRLPKVRCLEIHAPSLDSFNFLMFNVVDYDYVIKILGAKLTDFKNWGHLPEKLILTGNTVQRAYLCVSDQLTAVAGLRSRILLNQFSNLRKLKLSCDVTQAIAETKSGLPIPMYNKLGKLKLMGYDQTGPEYSANVESMFLLLHAAPLLDYLVIDIGVRCDRNSRDQGSYEQVEDGYDYVAVESVSVPSCLSQLKKVKFKRLDNNPHQFNLVRFLLKNCPQLEEFRFNCDYGRRIDVHDLKRKLSSLPRAPTAPTKRVVFNMSWKL